MLLIAPALFILLQVALARHHHYFKSCHDDKNSLHTFPAAFHPDQKNPDTLTNLAPAAPLFALFCLWIRTQDSPEAAVTALIADPPQSRAPPYPLFS